MKNRSRDVEARRERVAALILATEKASWSRLAGLRHWERAVRVAEQLHLSPVRVLFSAGSGFVARNVASLPSGTLASSGGGSGKPNTSELFRHFPRSAELAMIIPGDRIVDPRILRRLAAERKPTVVVDGSPPADLEEWISGTLESPVGILCGPVLIDRKWLRSHNGELDEQLVTGLSEATLGFLDVACMPMYADHLRRPLRPYWFPSPRPEHRRQAKKILLQAVQKGSQDLPAWVHSPIEKWVAWKLSDTPITPNQITVVNALVAFSVTGLFLAGHLALGLTGALVVGVLDGIDGKLARLRFETSKLGELEHWVDFAYEWSWWAALAFHFSSTGQLPGAGLLLLLLAVAESLDGLAKWSTLRRFHRTIDEMGALDRFVRLFGGRRNVYIWLLTAGLLTGHVTSAFRLLPWWEGFTAAIHCLRASALPWRSARSSPTAETDSLGAVVRR